MSAQNDYTEVKYEGAECHVPHSQVAQFELPKPNYSIRFHNANNEEIGIMDFNNEGLEFQGNATESAMAFVGWIAECFAGRLKDERNKVRKELEEELLKLRKGVAANSEYIQGRWDLIGEFQDIIKGKMES